MCQNLLRHSRRNLHRRHGLLPLACDESKLSNLDIKSKASRQKEGRMEHTHTHTHTQRVRARERERERQHARERKREIESVCARERE
jgi:hypothetical protein